MKRCYSVIIISLVILFVFSSFSVFSVSALDESITEITTDGWVNYKKLNVLQFTYKTNPSGGYSDVRYTKTVNNLSLPYGPKYYLLDNGLIEEFWITVSLMNVDVDDPTQSDIAVLKPGEAIALNAGLKLWFASFNSQDSFAPITAAMYECRLYLDDDYTKYITPTLDTSTQNGASLYWSFTNNTDKDIVLSRISMGVFGDHEEGEGQNIYNSYGYGYALRALKYRIFTDSQMATQAIVDSITDSTNQIVGGLDDLGDQIGGSIEESTDQILNGWDGSASDPEGSEVVTDVELLESDLLSYSGDGLSSIGSLVTDTSNIFDSMIGSFNFVKAVFNQFNSFDIFGSILTVSLAFGLFAFLLGVLPSALSRFIHKGDRFIHKGGGK